MPLRVRRLVGETAAPAAGVAAAACFTSRVVDRMQSEHETTETLKPALRARRRPMATAWHDVLAPLAVSESGRRGRVAPAWHGDGMGYLSP